MIKKILKACAQKNEVIAKFDMHGMSLKFLFLNLITMR